MKRIALFLTLAALICCKKEASANANSAQEQKRSATAVVKVRSAPNTTAAVLGQIERGGLVETIRKASGTETIAGVTGEWYQIVFEGKVGFVFGGFLATAVKDKATPAGSPETFAQYANLRLTEETFSFGDVVSLTGFSEVVRFKGITISLSKTGTATVGFHADDCNPYLKDIKWQNEATGIQLRFDKVFSAASISCHPDFYSDITPDSPKAVGTLCVKIRELKFNTSSPEHRSNESGVLARGSFSITPGGCS